MLRVAINGFGRIGKNFLRVFLQDQNARKKMTIVAINIGPGDPLLIAHLFKYDTLLGIYPGDVTYAAGMLIIDGTKIAICAHADPADLEWRLHAIDWVVESSGCFTDAKQAKKHLESGAKQVLISAPAHGEDIAIVPGVNLTNFHLNVHKIVSLGSCTTNAFMPMVKIVHEAFGIEHGMMTTTHSYTNTQVLLDIERGDLRRSRAAALNIIPTTTGADKMMEKFFPDLAHKISSIAIRVPVAKVSLIDFTFLVKQKLSVEILLQAVKKACSGPLKTIVAITDEALVSSDFSGNSNSVIIDAPLTAVQGNLGKLFGWYDNEWAYSVRLKDFLMYVASLTS